MCTRSWACTQRINRAIIAHCSRLLSLVLSLVSVSPLSLHSRRLSSFPFILLCILLFSISLLIPLLPLRKKDQPNQPNQVSDIHTYIYTFVSCFEIAPRLFLSFCSFQVSCVSSKIYLNFLIN